jgi:hypothetical protein
LKYVAPEKEIKFFQSRLKKEKEKELEEAKNKPRLIQEFSQPPANFRERKKIIELLEMKKQLFNAIPPSEQKQSRGGLDKSANKIV